MTIFVYGIDFSSLHPPPLWAHSKCNERVLLVFKIWTAVLHAVKDLSD